jgi:hypothetical protein
MMDPGAMFQARGMGRALAGLFGICGVIFFAIVLGFVVDAIQENLDTIKKGRCNIVEKEHLLILGWTEACYLLLKEIAFAIEDQKAVVVVLCTHESDQRKEMMKRIDDVLPNNKLEVIVRNGLASNVTDLMTVAVGQAHTIIVPAPHGDATDADNSVLSITMALNAMQLQAGVHIVAELRDVDHEDMVTLLGGGTVIAMVSHDIVGRLMTMAARQPGLADIFSMLLGFDGDEFYMQPWEQITGLMFGELPELFPDAIVCGYLDHQKQVYLNPPLDYVMCDGDELLVIAESFDSYQPKVPKLREVVSRGNSPNFFAQTKRKLSNSRVFSSEGRKTSFQNIIRKQSLSSDQLSVQGAEVAPSSKVVPSSMLDAPSPTKDAPSPTKDAPSPTNDRAPGSPSLRSKGKERTLMKSLQKRLSGVGQTADVARLTTRQTYKTLCNQPLLDGNAPHARHNREEKFLIIGMRRDLRDILRSMNQISCNGTQVHLFIELWISSHSLHSCLLHITAGASLQ